MCVCVVCACTHVCVYVHAHVCSVVSDSWQPHWLEPAWQAPLSLEFSRQEYWSRLPFPSSGDLPNPGVKSVSLASLALAGRFFTIEPPGNQPYIYLTKLIILCFIGIYVWSYLFHWNLHLSWPSEVITPDIFCFFVHTVNGDNDCSLFWTSF